MTRVPSPDTPTAPALGPGARGLVVITVAHHSGGVLPALAADLARQEEPPSLWLVVDNSPQTCPVAPDSLEPAAAGAGRPLRLRLLPGEEGAGFGAGCNRALRWLEERGWPGWVWLLNPDTALPRGDEVRRLGQALAGVDPASLVGTAVEDGSGALEASAGWFTPGLRFRSRRLDPRGAGPAAPRRLDWLSGCSLALRPSAHTPPARFDPAFPLYYEDMDLCLRLGRLGAPVLWLPEPRVIHRRGQGSGSASPRRFRLSTVSYLRFLRRHCPVWVLWLRTIRLLTVAAARLPLQPGRSRAVLAGALEAWGDVWCSGGPTSP
ncbi:MAG: glycosyltransferase family 2 protein [Cyanobacteriota bacterium]|nr:glycosyltransferase family 2 protein [Cyanobacteriota bacterium]